MTLYRLKVKRKGMLQYSPAIHFNCLILRLYNLKHTSFLFETYFLPMMISQVFGPSYLPQNLAPALEIFYKSFQRKAELSPIQLRVWVTHHNGPILLGQISNSC